MGVTLSFLRRVLDRMGGWRVVVRLFLQFLCYVVYFLQPFLLRSLLGASLAQAETVACAVALAVALLMPSVVDLLNNRLFQDARRCAKSVVWDTVLERPYPYFVERPSGEILSAINEASLAARRLEDTFVHAILRMMAMVVLYTAAFCTFSLGLAVAYLAFIAVFVALSVCSARGGGERVARALRQTAAANASVLDACRNVGSILTLRSAQKERRRMDDQFGREAQTYVDVQGATNSHALAQQVVLVACALCLMVPMTLAAGEDTVASQTTLLTLLYSILNLTGFGGQCLLVKELLDRVGASLANVGYGSGTRQRETRAFEPAAEALRVEGVSFSYDASDSVIDGLSCEFARRRVTALVGSNGCGKSTLLKMLAGLVEPEAGSIVMPCGRDETVMLLDQDAILFDRSIMENVCYPREAVDADEVMGLVGAIGLEGVVGSEEQLQTLTPGELGGQVSGGEQQKILILRALVTRPAVLLCDEITANLDEGSTRAFYALLRERLPETTVVCVVHREEELAFFDDVVRIAPGDWDGEPGTVLARRDRCRPSSS